MKHRKAFPTTWFQSKNVFYTWAALLSMVIVGGTFLRFWDLANPLIEPHPIRQSQTALTATLFAEGRAGFFNYQSPYGGALWNFVHELPLYQLMVSLPMRAGLSVEVSSRLVTLLFFIVGTFFFLRLVRRFLGEQSVPWALLAYLASPFCIVYSRTCLVDFSALAFLLASLEIAFQAVTQPKRPSIKLLLLACVLGCIAAAMKTNLWFSPITAFCLYVGWQNRRGKLPLRTTLYLWGQALVQLVVVCAWIRWTMAVRGQAGLVLGEDTQGWIIGPWALRFTAEPWIKILTYWVRSLWHDWMLLPACLAFFSPYRNVAFCCLGISLFSIVATFNVHSFHDYYLIGEAPYLLAIVGAGLAHAFNLATKTLKATRATSKKHSLRFNGARLGQATLALTALVLVTRIGHLSTYFAPIFHDYRNELSQAYALKSLTTPDDLVYVESQTEQWEIPLYSHRNVILSPYFQAEKIPAPTVFHSHSGMALQSAIHRETDFWIDSDETGFEVLRTEERGIFIQDPSRHLWMGNSLDPMPTQITKANGRSEWTTCNQEGKWLKLQGIDETRPIEIVAGSKRLQLPYRPYVYLPSNSAWGCHFQIEPVLRSAASSNAEM